MPKHPITTHFSVNIMQENSPKRYNNPFTATLTGIRDLFKKQVPAGELKLTDRLDGKTVLVDGSSSGLGFAVAVDAARRGATLIMACRSGIPQMGERVKKMSGNSRVYMLPVDFADVNSIRSLVDRLVPGQDHKALPFEGYNGIDILVCNAGIVPKQSRKTPQGLEEMFMVNYFSKFLFVNILLEKRCIREAIANEAGSQVIDPSRIIFVASESHRNPEAFDWEAFGKYRDYSIGKSIELYGYYKLLLTTFSVELSRRLNPEGKTRFSVFSMCPGPVNSNIAREAPKIFIPLMKVVFGIFFRSPAKAAVPVLYLCASPDVAGKPFDYLFLMGRREVDSKASDPENGRKLWELSELLSQRV